MNDMKLIMENWRKNTLNEVSIMKKGGPTVGQFMTAMAKAKPDKMTNWLGGAAKLTAVVAGGALLASVAGPAGVVAGAAIGKATDMVLDRLADKGDEMARTLIGMLSTPDDQRNDLNKYFDLDDPYETLLQGLDSKLGKKLVTELYVEYEKSLSDLVRQLEAKPELANEPLGKYISSTANEFFRQFIANNDLSGVGLQISAPTN